MAALVAMVVIAFVIPLAVLVRSVARDRAISDAEALAQAAVPTLAAVRGTPSLAAEVTVLGEQAGGTASYVGAAGESVAGPAVTGDWLAAARQGAAFVVDSGGGVDVVVPVVTGSGPADVLVLHLAPAALRRGVVTAWLLLGGVGIGLLAVSVVVGDRMARGVVRPSEDLARVASRLQAGHLDQRVVPAGPPEVERAGHALNLLAGRIQDLVRAERESVADLSHRLRTPLTAMRLDAEALHDPVERDRLGTAADELSAAVDDVIRAARRRSDRPLVVVGDLAAVARDRVAFWTPLAEDQDRRVAAELPRGPAPVAASDDDLEAALDALIGNVVDHTPEGTDLRVAVSARPNGWWRLVVEDDGPGMAEGSDQRGHSGAGSTGLGLDIVRRTAEASGGGLVLGRSPSGGARVEVELRPAPRSPGH